MIKKFLPLLSTMAAIALAACQTGAPAETAVPAPPPTSRPTIQVATEPPNAPGCSVVNTGFAPEPPANSPFPAVSDEDWSLGPADAVITIVEYGDFQ